MLQAQILPSGHFSPSVSLIEGRPATTSLAIAEHFGKRHPHVMRDIRNLCAELPEEVRGSNFGLTFRTVAGPNNSERQEEFFTVFFDGFILLVMGYTGKQALQIKLGYISAFNAMREQLERRAAPTPLPDPVTTITPSTPSDRAPLRSIVNAWARVSGLPHDALWPQVRAAFGLLISGPNLKLDRTAIFWRSLLTELRKLLLRRSPFRLSMAFFIPCDVVFHVQYWSGVG